MAMIAMVVGGTTDTSARFVARVDTGPVRIVYSVNSDMSSPQFSASTAASSGRAKVEVTGLDPDTQYYWQVEDNGTIDTSVTGRFRTMPELGEPGSFMFAAASCAGQGGEFVTSSVSDSPVFDYIRGHDPLFFAHLGDLHYRDIAANTIGDFRQAYLDVFTTSRQGRLYREAALFYVWDDHDFAGDNSNGGATSKPAAQGAYREWVPHPTLPDADAIYQTWGCGRVLFIASDVRSNRSANGDTDGPSKTMLGSAQKAWMESVLTSPGFDAQFFVWLMPSQWMGTSSDSWNSFQTERAEMVQLFGDTGWLDRMCIVSGDVHALAIDSGANNQWGGFPVFQFASMDSRPQTAPTSQYDLGPTQPGRGQYGTVSVHDSGSQIAVTGTGWRRGIQWRSHTSTLPLSTLAARRRGPRSHVLAL